MKVRTAYVEQLEKDKARARCRRWRLWVRTTEGKRSRRFKGAYREALAALQAFRSEIEAEVSDPEKFAAYADAWVGYRKASGEYAPGTLRNDEQHVAIIKAEVGDMRMDAITPDVCRAALVAIRTSRTPPLSGTYMNKIYVTFHAIMSQAYRDGRIARDPLANIPAPKVDTEEKGWMEPSQLAGFIGKLSEQPLDGRVVACYLMAYLGLRRGEACAMHVEDVDFATGTVHVRRAVKERDGTVDKPKSAAGIRDLPMPDELAGVLGSWLSARDVESKYLACSSTGTVLRPQNLYKWWMANRDGLGAGGMTIHQIRHSNLSMMARRMSVFDLQRWAGWSSIEPAKIYVHADDESMRLASRAAFAALNGGAKNGAKEQQKDSFVVLQGGTIMNDSRMDAAM